jgi:hypothetical protein
MASISKQGEFREDLLALNEVPDWFTYPHSFIRIVDSGLTVFKPWRILKQPHISSLMRGLTERFPERRLIPFAVRMDCDDVACWEQGEMPRVVIVHDFASPGWERRKGFDDVAHWLRAAIADFIEFDD